MDINYERLSIEMLIDKIWDTCVSQRAAENHKTLERWQTDELAHVKERFNVQPISDCMRPLIEDAVTQWEEIERIVVDVMKMGREQYLDRFRTARQQFLKGNNDWRPFVFDVEPLVHGAVRNMEWVNLFSWILPAADPEHKVRYCQIGQITTSLLYMECLARFAEDPQSSDNALALRKIEARWILANV